MADLTDKEKLMATIWASALGQTIRSPNADFLALGGSSLLAMQIAAEASKKFGKHVSVVDILMSSSLRELVSSMEADA